MTTRDAAVKNTAIKGTTRSATATTRFTPPRKTTRLPAASTTPTKAAGTPKAASMAPPTREEWHHRLVYGLVELEPVSVNQVCPGGTFTQAHTEVSLPNGIVQMIVGVIYTPSTIQIWCASGAYYEGTLNESGEVVQLLAPVGEPLTPEVEAARDAYAQRVLLGG